MQAIASMAMASQGIFAGPVDFIKGPHPNNSYLVDVNQDGRLDVVVAPP